MYRARRAPSRPFPRGASSRPARPRRPPPAVMPFRAPPATPIRTGPTTSPTTTRASRTATARARGRASRPTGPSRFPTTWTATGPSPASPRPRRRGAVFLETTAPTSAARSRRRGPRASASVPCHDTVAWARSRSRSQTSPRPLDNSLKCSRRARPGRRPRRSSGRRRRPFLVPAGAGSSFPRRPRGRSRMRRARPPSNRPRCRPRWT